MALSLSLRHFSCVLLSIIVQLWDENFMYALSTMDAIAALDT